VDNWSLSWDLIVRASLLLFAGYVVYNFLSARGRADFVIWLRNGCVEYKGFPLSHQPAVTQLLLHDMGLKESAKIMGARCGGAVRIWFRSKLSPAEKQRIRNFLTTRL
jgi:hypothetical protein